MHFDVQPSLHPNCHHQIIFAKLNLTNFYRLTFIVKQLVWYYQQPNFIKRAIELSDWEKSLSNLDVNKQVSVFNETIMNIFENFIPHETITYNEKDPPLMTKQIKRLIAEKNALDKRLKRRILNSKLPVKLDACKLNYKVQSIFLKLNTTGKSQKKKKNFF